MFFKKIVRIFYLEIKNVPFPIRIQTSSLLSVIVAVIRAEWDLGDILSRRRYEPREDDAWVEDASHLRSIHDRRSYLLGGGLCLSRTRI